MKKQTVISRVIRIAPDLYSCLKELSIKEGKPIKFMIDREIRNYLKARRILKE